MDIAIVGAGTVGTAVGVAWVRAGHRVIAVSGRDETAARASTWFPGVPLVPIAEAVPGASLVAVGVPDPALETIVPTVASSMTPAHACCTSPAPTGWRCSIRSLPPVAAPWRCIPCRPSPTWPERFGPWLDVPWRSRPTTRRASWRVRSSAAISVGSRSDCPRSSARCTTRPPCSRRTISSRSRVRRRSCFRARVCPTRWRRCARSNRRRSPTCTGWGLGPR